MSPPGSVHQGILPDSTALTSVSWKSVFDDWMGMIQSASAAVFASEGTKPGFVSPRFGAPGMALENGFSHWQPPTPGVPVLKSQPGPPKPRKASSRRSVRLSRPSP